MPITWNDKNNGHAFLIVGKNDMTNSPCKKCHEKRCKMLYDKNNLFNTLLIIELIWHCKVYWSLKEFDGEETIPLWKLGLMELHSQVVNFPC